MTDPTRPRPTRLADDSPAPGDHSKLETDQARRNKSSRRADRFSSLVIAGVVALIILIAFVLILVLS
jgi:hypothetical protein